MEELPSVAGAAQVTVKPPSAGTTVTFCGAPGTAKVVLAVALCGDTAKATNRSDDANSETNLEFVFITQILLFRSDLLLPISPVP
jgi:hypothetical protein